MVAFACFIFFTNGCGQSNAEKDLQRQVTNLEAENTTLRSDKEELQNRVATLEAEVEQLHEQEQPDEISRKPKDGWEQYFPEAEETTLTGESTNRVRELLGRPPVLIRSIAANQQFNREIWVYMPFDEDPTGLYLFFKGDRLDSSLKNEFNGLYGSGLLDIEEFWVQ
jgi:hypothetical protein